MRKRTWKEYNKRLVNRGSITFFIDKELLEAPLCAENRRGRPRLFSMTLIRLLLILKNQYRLTYRSLEGFSKSILPLIAPKTHLPTYSLIAKRAPSIDIPILSSKRPQVILLDATGFKVYGEGEWKVKIHGKSKRRRWMKLHVAVDENTGALMAIELTEGNAADCKQARALLSKCPKSVKEVKADGGYDTREVRTLIKKRGATPLIPPRKNARKTGILDRDQAAAEIRGLGGDLIAKQLWGRLSGYSRRALVESSFSRMKRLYGSNLYSKKLSSQKVEVSLKSLMMNMMLEGKRG